jgi:protease-4
MKSFIKHIFATIIGILLTFLLIIILIIGITSLASSSSEKKNRNQAKNANILTLNLSNISIVERIGNNLLSNITSSGELDKKMELKQVLDNIEKAKNDSAIKAIYINTSFINAGLSQTEEIRNKLLEFKQTEKPIIAYSETYSQNAYYLASVANKIYLNPEGFIDLKGFSISQIFFKDLLKKLDIDIQIVRHGKFKSAIEPFTLNSMSKDNREQMRSLLNSFSNNIMDSIANQRNMSLAEIENDANNLNLNLSKNCLKLNYVDKLLYQDEVEDILKKISNSEQLKIVNIDKYTKKKMKGEKISRNKIAIIYATGTIKSGKGDEESIGSETLINAIRKARKDEKVKAIILRINSGGGSALASDVIWRETILAKKEKPFIISMGDYAASGGYYIACAADSIIANPTTLTGSIGVFGIIPNMQKFYNNKLGITIDTVNTNKYADMGINRPLSEFEKNIIQKNIKNVYESFITKVSEGRNINKLAVDEIAQGRVWSGYDAKKIGLIDSYGGIDKAIEIAALLSKTKDYRIISLPKKKDPFEEILSEFEKNTYTRLIYEKIGIKSKLNKPIEDLLKGDYIQERIPFIIMKLE